MKLSLAIAVFAVAIAIASGLLNPITMVTAMVAGLAIGYPIGRYTRGRA